MDLHLRIFLIIIIAALAFAIFYLLRKDRLELKYTLLWIGSILIMGIVVIFPDIVFNIAKYTGIINPVNLVFFVEGMFVVSILLSLTAIVSGLNRKLRRQTQELALLDERLRRIEKADPTNNNRES